jgi:hypothetical protein
MSEGLEDLEDSRAQSRRGSHRCRRVTGSGLEVAGMRRFLVAVVAAAAGVSVMAVTAGRPAAQSQRGLSRTADGKPDLSGFWQVMNTAHYDLEPHSAQDGVPGGLGVVEGDTIPYQPWAAEQKLKNGANPSSDPLNKCFLPGVPRVTYLPFPFQIAQTRDHIAIAYEFAHTMRIIYTDGSPHPGPLDFWMGDSRGRWEGDTLVVDTTHFNGRTWLDKAGNFHSEGARVIERYTPEENGLRMNYEVTIEDPKVYTRPWKMSMPIYRRAERNMQLIDYDCVDFFWQNLFDRK